MKKDIILSGVGGQGILSIATVIGEAATAASVNLKQAEVHGMSQRGGDVQSNLRLSTTAIHSDLIPMGKADIIISMEPMEALRYLPYLSENSVVITSSTPFVNIDNYPDIQKLDNEFAKLPKVVKADLGPYGKGANIALLGMASRYLEILDTDQLREAVKRVFASKGEEVVNANLKCFDEGLKLA